MLLLVVDDTRQLVSDVESALAPDEAAHTKGGEARPAPALVARPYSPTLFARAFEQVAAERTGSEAIIGKSKKMLDVLALVTKVAASNANVCIVGESGTGKELIARAIHDSSPRRDRPLVILDCPAVPDGLMESHLFGHVRGAFTGAVDHREGVFALAHTGTLFIDELCEISWPLQAKLLRVLQSREFFKVGGTKPICTDIRLITATNKDPAREVERGTFREDLYYRVAVVVIKVPPLRERRERSEEHTSELQSPCNLVCRL